MLDRNGLRPAKYAVTSDGLVVLASEFGVLPLDPTRVVQKGRVQPGKMFLVDTEAGRVISDEEIKHQVATQKPYREWLDENRLTLSMLPEAQSPYRPSHDEFGTCTLRMSLRGRRARGEAGPALRAAIDRLCREAKEAIDSGAAILILSDGGVGPEQAPSPSLLATSAVHHHLIRTGQR